MFLLVISGTCFHSAEKKARWSSTNCFPSQWMGDSVCKKEWRSRMMITPLDLCENLKNLWPAIRDRALL